MSKKIKKLSPFALGVALCACPLIHLPSAQAASLALGSDPSTVEPSAPKTSSLPADCLASALPPEKVSAPQVADDTPASDGGVSYKSSPDLAPATDISPRGAAPTAVDGTDPALMAQLEPGCELAGVAPQGGGALAAPLLPLLAAAPLGAIIPLVADDGNNPDRNPDRPPVPLSESSTAGMVAGFGLVGLWYSRRFR